MLNSIKNFFKGGGKTLITGTGAIASALIKPFSVPFEMASNILK
jgi:NADH:ubiquinone oxidoreductase subunit 6 (subunit J)